MSQGLIGTYKSSMYAFRDSNGYAKGVDTTPDTVSNGTVLGGYLYNKHISIAGATAQYETRIGRSGGKIWTKKSVGITDLANFALSFSGQDTTLEGYFKGYTPDATTLTGGIINVPTEVPDTLPSLISLHHIEYDNADGSSQWLTLCYLNAQFQDTGGMSAAQSGGENPNPLSYEGVPNYSLRTVWGQLWSANANQVVTDNRAASQAIYSNYRYFIATYIDDGSTGTYTLPYKPASSTLGHHLIFKNGAVLTVTSVSTSTGVVTQTAAATAGDIIVHLYPVGNTITAT